ncbi:MAG: FAD-dependent oxidoreductase [Oscillospiraceae bacterium]|nr:FAD-dependent oxidoreductase [Oscillospiraceae bacterium]
MKPSSKYLEPAKEIDVYGQFDVIVVGGGVAGWSAAVASARAGAHTLIIERFPYFGGTATASLMANIVGFRNQVQPNGIQTTKGLGEELILKLLEMKGAEKSRNAYESEQRADVKGDLSYNYAFDTEKFKYATLKMAVDSGLNILFHTYFSDVIMDGNAVTGIIFENKTGRQAAFAKVVVDASGDGDVALKAGVPYWQTRGDENSRLNDCLMYKISGFDPDTKAPGCLINDTMVVWGPSPGAANGADADELTGEEIKTRLAVYEDMAEKIQKFPDLAGANIVDTGSLLGIRQTRFIEGVYAITGDDVLEGRVFEDSVAMGANPVIHHFGYRRFLTHEGYDIPYRCFLPKVADGLLVAGRCMSSDQIAYESWRAMAHIFAIGEAAGVAASISAKYGVQPRDIDIKKLQSALIAAGAEIGQSRKK